VPKEIGDQVVGKGVDQYCWPGSPVKLRTGAIRHGDASVRGKRQRGFAVPEVVVSGGRG
jgi:hypothetical protein